MFQMIMYWSPDEHLASFAPFRSDIFVCDCMIMAILVYHPLSVPVLRGWIRSASLMNKGHIEKHCPSIWAQAALATEQRQE